MRMMTPAEKIKWEGKFRSEKTTEGLSLGGRGVTKLPA